MNGDFHKALAQYLCENDLCEKLQKDFPEKLFSQLNIPIYAVPKVHRLLPKGAHFENYAALKKHYLDRAILSIYEHLNLSPKKITIFTWVMKDGFGDFIFQELLAKTIKKSFPQVELVLITKFDGPHTPLSSSFEYILFDDPAAFEHLASSDLIIEAPTRYPDFDKMLAKLPSFVQVVRFGEYGLIDSPQFHPESDARCLGLHFLEKGVLIPEDEEVLIDHPTGNQYLGYVTTKRGFIIFLSMVCVHTKADAEIIFPKIAPFFTYQEEIVSFAKSHGVKRFELYIENNVSIIDIQDVGKTIKIFFKPHIDRKTFQSYMLHSPVVGCRGNQSLIEALAMQKPLFYDPVKHNLSFLYDLIAVIRDRTPELFPLFSLFVEALEEDVDAWQILGKNIAFSMQNTFSLFELLKREYCFNPVLEAVIKRAAFIKKHEEHLAWETEAMQKVLDTTLSFPSFYALLKGKLDG